MWVDIEYNINCMRYLSDQDMIDHLKWISIDCQILAQGIMRFKKSSRSFSNDQWLWYWEQKWFDIVDILHAIISKSTFLKNG